MSRRAPPPPPEFFIDRSLGRHHLAAALSSCGLTVHTLASVYGEQKAQTVADEEWLALDGLALLVVYATRVGEGSSETLPGRAEPDIVSAGTVSRSDPRPAQAPGQRRERACVRDGGARQER